MRDGEILDHWKSTVGSAGTGGTSGVTVMSEAEVEADTEYQCER